MRARPGLLLVSVLLCSCYRSFVIDEASDASVSPDLGTDAGGLTVCFADEQVLDAPIDGACHDFVIASAPAHAACNTRGDATYRAFRIAHPTQVREAYVTIACASSICDGELDLPYWQAASDCERCPASFSRGPSTAADAMLLHLELVDAYDGPDREPEYLVGRPPAGGGDPTFTVTLCTVAP